MTFFPGGPNMIKKNALPFFFSALVDWVRRGGILVPGRISGQSEHLIGGLLCSSQREGEEYGAFLNRPISAKRQLKKKGSTEGKELAGLQFPVFPEQIGRLTFPFFFLIRLSWPMFLP